MYVRYILYATKADVRSRFSNLGGIIFMNVWFTIFFFSSSDDLMILYYMPKWVKAQNVPNTLKIISYRKMANIRWNTTLKDYICAMRSFIIVSIIRVVKFNLLLYDIIKKNFGRSRFMDRREGRCILLVLFSNILCSIEVY